MILIAYYNVCTAFDAMVLLLPFNNGKLTDNLYLALEHNVQFKIQNIFTIHFHM